MSVGHNARTTTTLTPSTKLNSSEIIIPHQEDNNNSKSSSEQENNNIQITTTRRRRRLPRQGTITNWVHFTMPNNNTFDHTIIKPPSPNPVNSYDHPQTQYIVRKTLYEADLSLGQARLLLTKTEMIPLNLPEFLTPEEHNAVNDENRGLHVRAFDWHGREYGMLFKYLEKTKAYRLIRQWGAFLRVNRRDMTAGNVIETAWYRNGRNGEVCVDLRYVRVETHERNAVCNKNVRKSGEPTERTKIKRIKIKHARNDDEVVEKRRIVSEEPEFPTADELLVAEALLMLKGKIVGDKGMHELPLIC